VSNEASSLTTPPQHNFFKQMTRPPKPGSKGPGGDDDDVTSTSDSDIPGSSSTPLSYTIPSWLIPEKQTLKFFSLPLLPVPKHTEKAVRSQLKKQFSQTPYKESTKMMHQIAQLQHDEKQANQKVKTAKEKLALALNAKTEGVAELRKSSAGETKKALENLETSMRKDQEQEYRQMKDRIRALVRVEYDQKFEEERDRKRKREDEVEQKQEEEENRATSQKLDHVETMEGGDKDSPTDKIAALLKKRSDLQEKMAKLSESKSEMFWLLKQVIMQENKQKIALMQQQNKTISS
jgi:hypothetical protein